MAKRRVAAGMQWKTFWAVVAPLCSAVWVAVSLAVGVVALDLLGFPSVLGDRVRARVGRIPAANILIGATHTHSAPDSYALPDGKGGHTGDLKYMDLVCEKAAEALKPTRLPVLGATAVVGIAVGVNLLWTLFEVQLKPLLPFYFSL